MIIVKLKGGLGNQMRQYAAGRRLALKYQVPLKLDISFYSHQGKATRRQYSLDAFNVQASIASSEEVKKILGWEPTPFLKRALNKLRIRYYNANYWPEKPLCFDPDFLVVSDNTCLEGDFRSYKYFDTIRPVLLADFALRNGYSPTALAWAEKITATSSVSVHIRRGDYVYSPETNAYHGLSPLAYYHQAVAIIKDRVKDPSFFVFSDDQEWCRENLSFLAGAKFISGVSDQEELILMSRCRHNIIANSSFGWWGAWLNDSPGKTIIAPQRWFNDQSVDISDLLPENWLKI